MDRNQLTGFVLIFAILLGYWFFFRPQPVSSPPDERGTEQVLDSVADTPVAASEPDEALPDSVREVRNQQRYGSFANALQGQAREIVLENQDVKIALDTRGGRIKTVELKGYKTYQGQPLVLFDEQNAQLDLLLGTANGDINLADLYFQTDAPAQLTIAEGDSQQVTFTLPVAGGTIRQTYSLAGQGYQIGYALQASGLDGVLRSENLVMDWRDRMPNMEKDIQQSRAMATINYYGAEDGFDELDAKSQDPQSATPEEPLQWVSFKHKFFTSALIADGAPFPNAQLTTQIPNSETIVKNVEARLSYPVSALQEGNGAQFRFYFGPNDYKILKKVAPDFEDNVYLGWTLFAFINKFIIINLFQLLEKVFSNYGIIIIVMVLIIKLFLLPLSYRSYLSTAKTKVLKPELDELKAKYGDDMQKMQAEQMKLYQQVGINPISGCIPLVLQMPFLLAMFYFFPNAIELRQEPFLWAEDLSTYDSIFNLPFTIPGFGAHVSLFTLLMTASQIAFTYYNNQVQASTMQGPMKSITYIMPVVFMFVLNSYPAGLSFYYFVSNLITITQQNVIKRFVDDDKIRAKLEANKEKKKTKKKSGFQERLAAAMKAAEDQQKRQQTRKK
ncbi:YidC/Oxa1 family membrane protein insertase [Catalinimonas alkaloidigena]|uniref:Membrane protein insertase YidC n=1 Tax=Catalinimonas alkaloidigena TaxID=1075417 RepID=A0A1G9UAT3_9BACT|nr:membrane protein insertase YidC [Catalinimonas alkaloidigena]SDM56943.1 YidC/Oxa1 family membrane protein insertase [Catalinimonas alkaloidigena]